MYNNKFFTKKLKNNLGFTLVENLVAIGLLGIVIIVGTQGFEAIKKGTQQMTTLDTTQNRVFEIIYRVRANASKNIVSFPGSIVDSGNSTAEEKVDDYINKTLDISKLPMAWSLQEEKPISECANCPGKYGYIITAVPRYGSLYRVTIRMTHKDWGSGPTDFKEYNFLITQ